MDAEIGKTEKVQMRVTKLRFCMRGSRKDRSPAIGEAEHTKLLV